MCVSLGKDHDEDAEEDVDADDELDSESEDDSAPLGLAASSTSVSLATEPGMPSSVSKTLVLAATGFSITGFFTVSLVTGPGMPSSSSETVALATIGFSFTGSGSEMGTGFTMSLEEPAPSEIGTGATMSVEEPAPSAIAFVVLAPPFFGLDNHFTNISCASGDQPPCMPVVNFRQRWM